MRCCKMKKINRLSAFSFKIPFISNTNVIDLCHSIFHLDNNSRNRNENVTENNSMEEKKKDANDVKDCDLMESEKMNDPSGEKELGEETSGLDETKVVDDTTDVSEDKDKDKACESEACISEAPAEKRNIRKSVNARISNHEKSDEPLPQGKKKKVAKTKKHSKKSGLKKSKVSKKRVSNEKSEVEYEVDKILGVKTLKNGNKEYLVRWKGFSAKYDTWEPEANLDCEDLIKEYYEENKKVITTRGKEENKGEGDTEIIGDTRSSEPVEKPGKKKSSGGRPKGKGKAQSAETKRASSSRKNNSIVESEGGGKEGSTQEGRVTRNPQGKNNDQKNKKRKLQPRDGKSKRMKKNESREDDLEDKDGGKSNVNETEQDKENVQNSRTSSKDKDKWAAGEELGDGEGGDREYEVEKIVNVRYLKNGSREFLIKWRGYSMKDNSWEPETHLNCSDILQAFLKGMEEGMTARVLRYERKKTERFSFHSHGHPRKSSVRLGKLPKKSYREVDENSSFNTTDGKI